METNNIAEQQFRAQVATIESLVAALDVDYERLEELREAKKNRYVAGWNMPGYLREMDPQEFDDFDAARQYIVDAIDRAAEDYESESEAAGLETDARNIEREPGPFISQQCGNYVYWVIPVGFTGVDDAELEELEELEEAAGNCESEDDARERIQEMPLSVEVRSRWASVGDTLEPAEFRIVLCTGGPHVEIQGELTQHNEPCRAWVVYKDWDTSGRLFDVNQDVLLKFCNQFYFGE